MIASILIAASLSQCPAGASCPAKPSFPLPMNGIVWNAIKRPVEAVRHLNHRRPLRAAFVRWATR